MLPGGKLELHQVPGAVVVDVVRGVDTRGPGLVIIHGHRAGGGRGPGPLGSRGHGGEERGVDSRVSLPVSNIEHHLHVVRAAEAAGPPVDVSLCRGGDEVICLARLELQAPGGGGEGPEGDGEVHEALRLVADGHNLGLGVGHSAALEFLLGHAVHNVFLQGVVGADQVQLVILPRQIPVVDIHNVICVVDAEDGICRVPINFVDFCQGFTYVC